MKKDSKIQDALRQIVEANPKRQLLPSEVVESARDPENPLHGKFCWDDTKAAHEYRLWQARQLIASVEIVADNRFESAPEYVSLMSDRRLGGYRPVVDVMSNAKLREEMLATATMELDNMQFRFDRLHELAGVFREAKKVKRSLTKKKKQVA